MPETAQITEQQIVRSALASLPAFGGKGPQAAPVTEQKPQATAVEAKPEIKQSGEVIAEEDAEARTGGQGSVKSEVRHDPKQEAEETPEVKAEPTWLDAALGTQKEEVPVTLGDTEKSLFKSILGTDNPLEYKKAREAEAEELNLLRPVATEHKQLKEFVDNLPPAFANALLLLKEGKDPSEYLRGLNAAVALDKPASEIKDLDLIDMYFPGKITAEDKARLKDPEVDDDIKSAIKDKIKVYLDPAKDIHEQKRSEPKKAHQAAVAEQEARIANQRKSVATNVANAKGSFVGPLVTQESVREFESGKLINDFVYQEDGSFQPDLYEAILFAKNRKAVMTRLQNANSDRERSRGVQEATAKLPTHSVANRTVTAANEAKPSVERSILEKVARSV